MSAATRGVRRRVQRGAYWALGARRGPRQRHELRDAIAGRVVLVTGASDGIGEIVARDCAAAGAVVLLVARRRERLEQVRDDIIAVGGQAHVHPADLADMDDVERLAAEVLAAHGHVDVLVNNAGRSIRRAVADTVDRFHDVERVTQLNYFGAVRLTLALLAVDARAGRGPRRAGLHPRDAVPPAPLLGLPRGQGGPRGVQPGAGHRGRAAGRHRQRGPHAPGAHRHDRPDQALRARPCHVADARPRPWSPAPSRSVPCR